MPSNSTYLYRLQKYLPVTFYTDWLFPWPLSILLASSHLIATENIGAVTKEGQDGADFCIAAMDKPRASCNFLVPIDWAPRVGAVSFFKDWKWKERKRRVIKSLKHSILALNLFTSHWIKNAVIWSLLTMVFKGITKRKHRTENACIDISSCFNNLFLNWELFHTIYIHIYIYIKCMYIYINLTPHQALM